MSGSPAKTCAGSRARRPALARPEPGSVIAMKCAPSATSEKKCANSDSGSIVPPDFEETMNSVRCGSIGALHGERCRRRRWSRARAGAGCPALLAEGAAQHLGSERGAAHAEQDHVCEAVVAHSRGERLDLLQLGEHALGDRQPAEAVGDLGRAGRRPTASRRLRADAARRAARRRAARLCWTGAASEAGTRASTVRLGSLTPRS